MPQSFGLRTQILLSLLGLLSLGLISLFVAVFELVRSTGAVERDRFALTMTDAVLRQADGATLIVGPPIQGVVRLDDAGVVSCHGAFCDNPPAFLGDGRVERKRGGFIDVHRIDRGQKVVLRVAAPVGLEATRSKIMRVLVVYIALIGLAIALFTSMALTRLVVRPLEQLGAAADRIAKGERSISLSVGGSEEIVSLRESVRKMAESLLDDEARLRERLAELSLANARLTDAQGKLQQSERLASIGRLAAGVAHEIGNPISAIMGMVDLLRMGGLPPDTERDLLDRTARETERISRIVRSLLDFARPYRSADRNEKPPADVSACIAETVLLAQLHKQLRGVEIVEDAPEGLLVGLSKDELTQVLLNLLVNAGDAVAEADAKSVRIRAYAEGDRVFIEVTDTGPGVPDAVRENLFEPFVTSKDVGRGSGLGLAICRGIVESAGGHITLDTSHRVGARFLLNLPPPPT